MSLVLALYQRTDVDRTGDRHCDTRGRNGGMYRVLQLIRGQAPRQQVHRSLTVRAEWQEYCSPRARVRPIELRGTADPGHHKLHVARNPSNDPTDNVSRRVQRARKNLVHHGVPLGARFVDRGRTALKDSQTQNVKHARGHAADCGGRLNAPEFNCGSSESATRRQQGQHAGDNTWLLLLHAAKDVIDPRDSHRVIRQKMSGEIELEGHDAFVSKCQIQSFLLGQLRQCVCADDADASK
jgi:hypothetical protein